MGPTASRVDQPTCRSQSGAAVDAHDVRRAESRVAIAVTPSRLRQSRQLGCQADAGPPASA